jgi:hypothetical protein
MLKLDDYKVVFASVGLIGVLLFASPTLSLVLRLPGSERFSELWVLGPGRMAEDFPFNVSAGSTYSVFLGVGNHMGESEYYRVVVKFRNSSEPLPNATEGVASSLPVLYAYNVFLSDGQVWEGALNFSFSDVVFGQNVSSVGRMRVNDAWVNVDKSAVWDETSNGFYYELFFELWIYNVEAGVFQYHNRYCGIWLNMTLSSIS